MKMGNLLIENRFFTDHEMALSVALESWVIIVPQRDAQAIDEVVTKMQRVGEPIRFHVARPREVYENVLILNTIISLYTNNLSGVMIIRLGISVELEC